MPAPPKRPRRRPGARRRGGLVAASAAIGAVAGALPTRDPGALAVPWAAAVGQNLARRSRPVARHGRTWIVAVRDEAWRQALAGMTRRIVARLRSVLGADAPARLDLRVDPEALGAEPAAPATEEAPAPVQPRADARPSPPSGAERIADADLRAAFERAHAAAHRRRPPGDGDPTVVPA